MKPAILLYCCSILLVFATDVYLNFLAPLEADEPGLEQFRAGVLIALPTANSIPATDTVTVGDVDYFSIRPGFQFIHDASLQNKAIVSGPATALDNIVWHQNDDAFKPDFKRAVRLNNLVEVRLNMNRHDIGERTITLEATAPGRTILQPDLRTQDPLEVRTLRLRVVPEQGIEVRCDLLTVASADTLELIHGRADRVKIIKDPEAPADFISLGGLSYRELTVLDRSN